MKNLKELRRTLSWSTRSNLHERTKDIKAFSLRIVGASVQFQIYIGRREQGCRYANLFGWNSSF